MMSVLLVFLSLAGMILSHQFAKRRGLKPANWVLLAALIGPLALVLMLFVPPRIKP